MGKSKPNPEKKTSKRKLSDIADDIDNSTVPAKKAKREKIDRKDKKDKKGHKEIKAEQADNLSHAEYDVEVKTIEEVEPAVVKAEPDKKPNNDKKEKKSKKEKKFETEVKVEQVRLVDNSNEIASSNKKSIPSTKKSSNVTKNHNKSRPESDVEQKPAINSNIAETIFTKDKKPKKSKKDKRANGIEVSDSDNKLKEAAAAAAAEPKGEANGEGVSSKSNRFICFIGNLPFSATKADIEAHFASLAPISVRLLTEKATPAKSRGIAFVEFDHFSHMKTCLTKFHHTEFTDSAGIMRKINVELTAGGGGKAEGRMDKVKERNFKLNEERTRRIAKEKQEKEKMHRNGGNKADVKKAAPLTEDPREDAYVHPSRRAHVPGRKF